jgi:hypothetical protein
MTLSADGQRKRKRRGGAETLSEDLRGRLGGVARVAPRGAELTARLNAKIEQNLDIMAAAPRGNRDAHSLH